MERERDILRNKTTIDWLIVTGLVVRRVGRGFVCCYGYFVSCGLGMKHTKCRTNTY